MFKLLRISATVFMVFLLQPVNSQQPVLVVKSFDYIWQSADPSRIIIPSGDSAKILIRNSFTKAIQDRWNVIIPEVSLSVKPLGLFSNAPKFKTKLKDKKPGKWYLFLQVYDQGNPPSIRDTQYLSTTLELNCMLINGSNDSIMMDRTFTVDIFNEPAPPDQVLLKRLPAYPASFVNAFDSIATWLFQTESPNLKSLTLKPACVFQETENKSKLLTPLLFKNDYKNINHLTAPPFSFNISGPKYEKIESHKNAGSNTASGTLTLLTGLGTNKSKSIKYRADYPLQEGDSIYHCLIDYVETLTAERQRVHNDDGTYSTQTSEYELSGRYTDPAFLNVVTLNADTLATFHIKFSNDAVTFTNYHQMWNGSGRETIMTLPSAWNNKGEDKEVVITGKTEGQSFTMKTSKETRIKEFYINDQLIAIVHGKDEPVRAFVDQPISTHQLKLFTILSALPYAYLNEMHPN